MPSLGADVQTAEARGNYELLLRWGPAAAGEPMVIEAFVADVASNAPIEGSLKLAFAGPGELTLEGKALSPGQYALSGRFPALGRYTVTATVRGPAGVDLLTTEVVLAPMHTPSTITSAAPEDDAHGQGGVPMLWLILALVLAVVLALLGYVAGRRAGDAQAARLAVRGGNVAAALLVISSFVGLAFGARDVSAHGGEDHGDAPAASAVAAVGNAVRLAKDIQFLLKVRTAPVELRTLTERRRVVGAVTLPPGARTTVIAPFPGRLEAAPDGRFPRLAEAVKRGQVIAVLVELPDAADRAGLAAERARSAGARDGAAASLRALRQELTRKRQIKDIVAAQELIDLEAAIGRTEAELAGARAAVEALTLGKGTTALSLIAPIDGIIGALNVTPGGQVEGGQALFEVVDLSQPWVAAKVFESDLARIDREAPARVLGDGFPAEGVDATPIALSPIVDATTRTVDVVYALAAGHDVRVNQFVRVDLPMGGSHEVNAVPAGAVLELDGVPSVWVKTRAEGFVARPVLPGRRDGGFVELRGELAPGDVVVVAGAPFLRGAPADVGAKVGH